jgi:hypothetical protein
MRVLSMKAMRYVRCPFDVFQPNLPPAGASHQMAGVCASLDSRFARITVRWKSRKAGEANLALRIPLCLCASTTSWRLALKDMQAARSKPLQAVPLT